MNSQKGGKGQTRAENFFAKFAQIEPQNGTNDHCARCK